jgi:hypothetical protein
MLGAAAPASAAGPIASTAHAFADLKGDGHTGADIDGVKVANDDHGRYVITITFATQYVADDSLEIDLDTDLDRSTGNPRGLGTDFVIFHDNFTQESSLTAWQDSGWVAVPARTLTAHVALDELSIVITINRYELGDTSGFNFFLGTYDSQFNVADTAPDTSSWRYDLVPLVALSLGRASAGAAKPGSVWLLSIVANRSDTGGTVGGDGSITCSASAGATKLVAVTHEFVTPGGGKPSSAVCGFALPRGLKQTTLKGTVTVMFRGVFVSHDFSARVT